MVQRHLIDSGSRLPGMGSVHGGSPHRERAPFTHGPSPYGFLRVIDLAARPTVEDDVLLLDGAAESDWSCIGELYRRHRDGALAVAMSVLADPVEAEDVVHDVFMDLPRMARSYDPRRGRPEQWLCRSVRNRAIDHVRRRARRQSRVAPTVDGPEALLALVPSRAASPADEAEAAEFLELLGRLDPRYAHLVRLAFVDGWSHSAIARITGIPLGTVKTRLRNSMRQIREMLADPQRMPTSRPTTRRASHAGAIVAVSAEPAFRQAVERAASGLSPVISMTPHAWAACLAAESTPRPAAVVLDLPSDRTKATAAIGALAARGWDDVPALIAPRGRDPVDLPPRDGITLVAGAPGRQGLSLATAVPALLTLSSDSHERARAIARILRGPGQFVVGDRLGRLVAVSHAAATLLGWGPRQLTGTYLTELSATSVTRAERAWQELVTIGQWSGPSRIRRPIGPPVSVTMTAWMVPSGGFVAAIAPDAEISESAA